MGVSSKQDCLLRKGIEGIIVVRLCEGVLISHTVYELLAYFSLFFWGENLFVFFSSCLGKPKYKREGLHRSHCAGIVQNHIISRWLKGFNS